ncbi:hypothetical protein CC86DRAFT_44323 [Ophiobolus disseminans]|uniref:Uncharacterized protein n=1 Tax=Ophiobolus disseminans TaxID=1469910 RepID=A0A6A6ZWY0_9PLEO|nr:hypothetical protein CC86DRAFT_44323 [Ophiobolus disseminans]
MSTGFTDLSRELRDMVYKNALGADNKTIRYSLVQNIDHSRVLHPGTSILSFLLASKHVCYEMQETKDETIQGGVVELSTEDTPAGYLLDKLTLRPETLSISGSSAQGLVNLSVHWGSQIWSPMEPAYPLDIKTARAAARTSQRRLQDANGSRVPLLARV